MNSAEVLKTLTHLAGPGGCRTNNVREFGIDGKIPMAVVQPRNAGQITEIVQFANSENLAMVPWGGGTSMGAGKMPDKYDIALSLRKLDAILELEPEDLTCSVQAGLTLSELNAVLAEYNLFAALDPPHADIATLGGITAANVFGPVRHQYGTVKDQILGMHMVSGDGKEVKSGGKVVKNVAGYDVHKLFIGSRGSLGVIAGLNLRLRPLPAVRKTMLLGFSSIPEAIDISEKIINSYLVPEFMVLGCRGTMKIFAAQSGISIPSDTTGLLVGIDNHPQNTEWQAEEIRKLVEGINLKCLSILEGESQDSVRRCFRDYPTTLGAELILKINFLLSEFPGLYERQKELQKSLHHPAYLLINPGTGVLHLIYDGIETLDIQEKEKYIDFIREESDLAASLQGDLSIERAPGWIKNKISGWGGRRSDYSLMQTIKKGLDPKNVMSPGRLNGGW